LSVFAFLLLASALIGILFPADFPVPPLNERSDSTFSLPLSDDGALNAPPGL
jgi:hypothetical protein